MTIYNKMNTLYINDTLQTNLILLTLF